VPKGRWFKITMWVRKGDDNTGAIKVWVEDALLFDYPNVSTGIGLWFGVGNYTPMDPGPSTVSHIFIDDVFVREETTSP